MRVLQASLLILAAILLLFAMWTWLIPRARYVKSNPAPGAILASTPTAVTIEFSENLDAASTASVVSTITLAPNGEYTYGDGKRFKTTGPSLDQGRRTLRIRLDPELPKGLYWVQWNAVAASSKAKRVGRFCFAVGMNVPDHILRDMPGALDEHNDRYRYDRAVVLSGVLLAGLGLLLPRLSSRK